MSKKVICVVNDFLGVAAMWKKAGYTVVDQHQIDKASLVQFTGGEDVNPALYGEKPHPTTYFSEERDAIEVHAFEFARLHSIPMVGICRGMQLLHVLSGGALRQHIPCHGSDHYVEDIFGNIYWSSSIHHQCIIPNKHTDILAWCNDDSVPEAAFWSDIGAIGVQGHPELYSGHYAEQRQIYFDYIEKLPYL